MCLNRWYSLVSFHNLAIGVNVNSSMSFNVVLQKNKNKNKTAISARCNPAFTQKQWR